MRINKCSVPHCKQKAEYAWHGGKNNKARWICQKCWEKHCDNKPSLYKVFNIQEPEIERIVSGKLTDY